MKLLKTVLILLIALSMLTSFLSCGDDGGSDDESVQINDEAEKMEDFPSDAEVYEPEYMNVNGEEVTGTDSTSVEDADTPLGDTSVTIPASLARADNNIVVFGYWLNGKMSKTAKVEPFDALITALKAIFSSFIDTSATDKIKIDNFPIAFIEGENYLCFYFETADGKKYRTPVVKCKYELIDSPF